MKIKVSFELDAEGLDAFDADTKKSVSEALQNFHSLLGDLQNNPIVQKLRVMSEYKDGPTRAALLKGYDEEIKLFSQIFDKYSVEGQLATGERFIFKAIKGEPCKGVEWQNNG